MAGVGVAVAEETGGAGVVLDATDRAIETAKHAGFTTNEIVVIGTVLLLLALMLWFGPVIVRRWRVDGEQHAQQAPQIVHHDGVDISALADKFGEKMERAVSASENRLMAAVGGVKGDVQRVEHTLDDHVKDDSRRLGLLFDQDREHAERQSEHETATATRLGKIEGDVRVVEEVIRLRKPRTANA